MCILVGVCRENQVPSVSWKQCQIGVEGGGRVKRWT